VLAARPTLRERAARWGRRHRRAVAAALGGLALALAGLLVATALLWEERGRTKAALERAQAQEAEARRQRRLAQANFSRALDGVAAMLTKLDPAAPGAPPPDGEGLRRALVEEGLRFFRSFIHEDDPDPAVRFEACQAYEMMARVHGSLHDLDNTRAMMERVFTLLDRLAAEHPEEEVYRKELVRTHYLMGLIYKSFGRPAEARQEYARTAELCRAPLPDAWAAALNTCAFALVDCPDETLRDPPLAVRLAERAVAQEPRRPEYWGTLGMARYRAGEGAKARAALERATELSDGGTAYDWLFLALTCLRQGDREAARAWQQKAVRWMEENHSLNEALVRYRKEVEALLAR
jgi:tetratricopeptide (TPR) repeat protein